MSFEYNSFPIFLSYMYVMIYTYIYTIKYLFIYQQVHVYWFMVCGIIGNNSWIVLAKKLLIERYNQELWP